MTLHTWEIWFLWFILYSMIGWAYESFICSVGQRKWINRGFLNGPYCPIYGSGALLVIAVLGRIRNPILLFFFGALLCCFLEYLTSYGMEVLFHARWWDYSKRRFNIHGRVCLIGAVVFGLFSALLIHFLHPAVVALTDRLTNTAVHLLSAALLVVFVSDCVITVKGLAGFPQKIEEIAAFMEEQKTKVSAKAAAVATEKLYTSEMYKGMSELRSFVRKKLNSQQRRMIAAFPALRFKRTEHNEMLDKIRTALKKKRDQKNNENEMR